MALDEAFTEPAALSGADEVAVEEFATRLRERVRRDTGLVASVGAGSGKQVAKIASGLAKPDGLRIVSQGREREVLARCRYAGCGVSVRSPRPPCAGLGWTPSARWPP